MGLTTRFADRHRDQLGAVRAKLTPKGAPETGAVNLTAHEIEAFDDPAAPGAHRSGGVRSSWLMTPATLRVGLAEGGQDRPPGGSGASPRDRACISPASWTQERAGRAAEAER